MHAIACIYLSNSPGKVAGSSKMFAHGGCADRKVVLLGRVDRKRAILFRIGRTSVPLVDYRVGRRRIFRSQLGNRPVDLPTFGNPDTVLLYESSSIWPVDSSRICTTRSHCFPAAPMENEDHR
jgi:hypothetical protein